MPRRRWFEKVTLQTVVTVSQQFLQIANWATKVDMTTREPSLSELIMMRGMPLTPTALWRPLNPVFGQKLL